MTRFWKSLGSWKSLLQPHLKKTTCLRALKFSFSAPGGGGVRRQPQKQWLHCHGCVHGRCPAFRIWRQVSQGTAQEPITLTRCSFWPYPISAPPCLPPSVSPSQLISQTSSNNFLLSFPSLPYMPVQTLPSSPPLSQPPSGTVWIHPKMLGGQRAGGCVAKQM